MKTAGSRMFWIVAWHLAASWLLGWWSLALVGFFSGVIRRPPRWIALQNALGAFMAWGIVMLVWAQHPAFGELVRILGDILSLPAGPVPWLSPLFAALLAGSAAVVGAVFSPLRQPT